MKRHRTGFILVCELLAFASPAFAQAGPFQKYIFDVHEHRPSPEVAAFAKQCGVNAPAQQNFAIGRDGWRPVKDLAREVAKADSEFLATAEIWIADGKPRMVITWSTNAEGAQEQLSCVDSAAKVTAQQINSWTTGGGGLDEIIIKRALNKAGDLARAGAEIMPNHGERKPMSTAQLSNELYQWGTKYPDNRTLDDYEFPAVLLKQGKK